MKNNEVHFVSPKEDYVSPMDNHVPLWMECAILAHSGKAPEHLTNYDVYDDEEGLDF